MKSFVLNSLSHAILKGRNLTHQASVCTISILK